MIEREREKEREKERERERERKRENERERRKARIGQENSFRKSLCTFKRINKQSCLQKKIN